MATTASRIANDQGVRLFYYLRITGLPYYFFGVIDPTSSVYGSAAWSFTGTGVTVAKGLGLPDDRMEQSVKDVVGGIATAERIRLRLHDFTAFDSDGEYRVMSRLFAAPGRFSAAGPVPELETRIRATDGIGDTFTVRNCPDLDVFTDFLVHIGTEAIAINEPTDLGNGRASIVIAGRNAFPCATGYPPVPYHRVYLTDADTDPENGDPVVATGIPGRNQYVTVQPITMIGRSAALYIGHMEPNGNPCTEAETLPRLIGRITTFDYGSDGGSFEIEIESLTGDLDEAMVAPGLAQATISRGFINLAPEEWRTFQIEHRLYDDDDELIRTRTYDIVVDDGFDNLYSNTNDLIAAIRDALNDTKFADEFEVKTVIAGLQITDTDSINFVPMFDIITCEDGVRRAAFQCQVIDDNSRKSEFRFQNRATGIQRGLARIVGQQVIGLLTVLGFKDESEHMTNGTILPPSLAGTTIGHESWIYAEDPAPSVFVPYGYTTGSIVRLAQPSSSAGDFFDDQGSGTAYARFGDGNIVVVSEAQDSLNRLVVTRIVDHIQSADTARTTRHPYYRVSEGNDATICQVVLMPSPGDADDQSLTSGEAIGRLLASNPAGTTDGIYNTLPEGVGLGWIDILDVDSLRKLTQADVKREFLIDPTTKFSDVFMPLAREYGWMIVWDPEASQVAVRRIMVPSGPVAHEIVFSDSNRCRERDRTAQKLDASSIRSAWTLKWGWDRIEKKFLGPDVTWQDRWVNSAFGGLGLKSETIEDKTLKLGDDNSAYTIVAGLLQRSYFYRQPWLRCRRSLTKAGLLLAPGSVHSIVDATLINPFSGILGVTAANRVYGMLMSVGSNPATGECEVEYTINAQDPAGLFRWFSPCGLVDFAASSHGYNSSTGALTMLQHFSSDGTSKDGIDFAVGDTVAIVSRDSGDAVTYYQETTVTAVATDGSTVTVATGLPALPSTTDVLLVLREYADATAARKLSVAFQGAESGVIEGTTDQDHRWL